MGLVDDVFPIELVHLHRAKAIVLERPTLPARTALHAAVMERRRATKVMSFDRDFDQLPGLERLY